jgi:hypothetical protein
MTLFEAQGGKYLGPAFGATLALEPSVPSVVVLKFLTLFATHSGGNFKTETTLETTTC